MKLQGGGTKKVTSQHRAVTLENRLLERALNVHILFERNGRKASSPSPPGCKSSEARIFYVRSPLSVLVWPLHTYRPSAGQDIPQRRPVLWTLAPAHPKPRRRPRPSALESPPQANLFKWWVLFPHVLYSKCRACVRTLFSAHFTIWRRVGIPMSAGKATPGISFCLSCLEINGRVRDRSGGWV